MRHLETKKLLISLTCISSICVTSCIVAVIPKYPINNSISNEQELVNKLSSIISNPIIISSDLTASEALYDNNYQTVSKLILNKIQTDLGNNSLNINGIIYSSFEIIKHLHITLPSIISYEEYEVGIISNVKLQYITNQGSINIIPVNGSSYTVKGFLVPQLTNTNQTVANSLSLHLKNPIQINDSLTASQALQTNNLALTINKIKTTIRNDLENNDLIINSNVTIPINQVLNNIHITLPNSVTTDELDNGMINNVILKYGTNNEVLIPNSNGFKPYTVQGFKIPTTNETDEQNIAIIHKLESLIQNPIVLNNGYSLTAAESISSDANKQILFKSIKEVIKSELGTNFIVNSVSYEINEVLKNIVISVPSSVTDTENNNQIIPTVTLSYKSIELKNNTGINYTIENLAKVTSASEELQYKAVVNYLSGIIPDPITLPYGNDENSGDFAYNATFPFKDGYLNAVNQNSDGEPSDNLAFQNSEEAFLAFKQEIVKIIAEYITTNNVVINSINYSKDDITSNIDVSLLLKGVTYNEIGSGEVNNMIALFYKGNSIQQNLIPILNKKSIDSWDVYGFALISGSGWKGGQYISQKIADYIQQPINIYSQYTAQEYQTAYVDSIDYPNDEMINHWNQIINSVNNLIINEVLQQLPNTEFIVNGIILNTTIIEQNISLYWEDDQGNSVPVQSNNELSQLYFVYYSPLLLGNWNIIPNYRTVYVHPITK